MTFKEPMQAVDINKNMMIACYHPIITSPFIDLVSVPLELQHELPIGVLAKKINTILDLALDFGFALTDFRSVFTFSAGRQIKKVEYQLAKAALKRLTQRTEWQDFFKFIDAHRRAGAEVHPSEFILRRLVTSGQLHGDAQMLKLSRIFRQSYSKSNVRVFQQYLLDLFGNADEVRKIRKDARELESARRKNSTSFFKYFSSEFEIENRSGLSINFTFHHKLSIQDIDLLAHKKFEQHSPQVSLEEFDKSRRAIVTYIKKMKHSGYAWSMSYCPLLGYLLHFTILLHGVSVDQAVRIGEGLKLRWQRELTVFKGSANFYVHDFKAEIEHKRTAFNHNDKPKVVRDPTLCPRKITDFLLPMRAPFFLKPVAGMRFCDRSRAPYKSKKSTRETNNTQESWS